MPPYLLATKLHQPALPPQRVHRLALVRRLDEGLQAGHCLSLISAPAGFGKTTCVLEWLAALPRPAAWLSLDSADNDPARFFTYLAAALHKIDPSLGRDIEGTLQSGQLPAPEAIAAALVNDLLQARQPFILVLDDFHLIQEPAVLHTFETLLANLPPQIHLVIITREDPQLPLARLRAHNRLTEIRAADLRFSGTDTAAFLNEVMGLSLALDEVVELESRTEGWIVGLQLAGLSMRGNSDPAAFINKLSGSHRHILNYLTEEVLQRLPEDLHTFLLQSSILDKLHGDLCDAVTGRSDSGQLLERLLTANLFLIPLDNEQQWYRYHHLFADLLRSYLTRLGKTQVAGLHQRAAAWYAQAGFSGEAIQHALDAEDYPLALSLLEANIMPLLMRGYARTVESWLKSFPPEALPSSPRTELAFAWMYLLRGNYPLVDLHLDRAGQALAALGEAPDSLNAELLCLRSNLSFVKGLPQEGIQQAQRAIELASPDDHFLLGSAYMGLGGAYRLMGDYPRLQHSYRQAIHHNRLAGNFLPEMLAVSAVTLSAILYGQLSVALEESLQAIQQMENSVSSYPPISATVYGAVGLVYYERNLLDDIRELFAKSHRLSRLSGHNAGVVYGKILVSRCEQAAGRLEEAEHAAREALDLLALGAPVWIAPEVAEQQVRILLARDQPAAAEAILVQFGLKYENSICIPGRLEYQADPLYLSALRLALHRGRLRTESNSIRSALALADVLIEAAAADLRNGTLLKTLVLRAHVNILMGHPAAAQDDLLRAMEIGEPEGYIRSFLDEGPALIPLLKQAYLVSPQKAYILRLLDAFGVPAATGRTAAQLPEPLTEREAEVLRAIAEGLKYEEIATRLYISLNTVRFYVKTIYGKLGVNNRTRAVDKARRLGII
ncbi:MAG: AAA family ATPase [Anaerolineaceae bacterium]|nr:AAA family ATPase [Anaerolineaceae bacterium]